MLLLILPSIVQQRLRSALLMLGLLVVSAGVLLVAAASETTVVVVDQDLTRYWRTTYDILVRPAGARSAVEEKYGLVEANHLSGIAGGITLAQYEAIKAIPGVEVAAPIAMLGYVEESIPTDDLGTLSEPGAYQLEQTITADDGAHKHRSSSIVSYYVGSDAPTQPSGPAYRNYPVLNPPFPIEGMFELPLLLAGIDPPQEAALLGLDRALLEGKYLAGNEPIGSEHGADPYGNPLTQLTIPILINATPYISLTLHAELKYLSLPPEASSLEAIMNRGGKKYLASLPGKVLASQELDSRTAYHLLVQNLTAPSQVIVPFGTLHTFAGSIPSRIHYRESTPPFPHDGLVLEIVLPDHSNVFGREGEPGYRSFPGPWTSEAKFNAAFFMQARGVFDIERLPKPADINRVPLETYFPPLATLRYGEEGNPVEPRTLRPTLNPAGYIPSPPFILTTLEAAHALRGEECISAIRVRVGGIDRLTSTAQRKIETIASEIIRRTGLTVDVMVGSSPRRVLVHVPGVGYVEEGWIQKGVNLAYSRRLQSGHLLLLASLLAIGGLYTLDLTWADVVARRRTIALQKALGWRSRTVFGLVVGQVAVLGTGAALLGALVAWALAWLAGWPPPSPALLTALPPTMTGLCALAGLYPAWLASRLPPVAELQRGGLGYGRRQRQPVQGIGRYAWQGLRRRLSRTVLGGLAAALSAALLVLLVAVTTDRHGYLSGTLLGEYLLLRVERYHYALVGIGLGLAGLAVGNSLLAGVLERQREVGILKAVGWRTTTVARLFLTEGSLLGLVGGTVGALVGGSLFWGLYRTLSAGLAGALLLGAALPGLVGFLAALYPAQVAARMPPAEVVRFE